MQMFDALKAVLADGEGGPREALIEALSRIEVHIVTEGPSKGLVVADTFADALIEALAGQGYRITPGATP